MNGYPLIGLQHLLAHWLAPGRLPARVEAEDMAVSEVGATSSGEGSAGAGVQVLPLRTGPTEIDNKVLYSISVLRKQGLSFLGYSCRRGA